MPSYYQIKKMRVTITLLACMLAFLSWCQEGMDDKQTEKSDTTKVSLGSDNEIIFINRNKGTEKDTIIDKKEAELDMHDFTYWSGLDIGFTGLMMSSETEQAYPWLDFNESKSIVLNLNVYETKIPLIKHYLGINTGLGFTFQDFIFNDSLSIVNIGGDSIAVTSQAIEYNKNKLKMGYVKIPLLIEINTSKNKNKNFHIAAGLIGGWNYRSVLKQKYKENGEKVKEKTKGDYNLSPLSLEATARFGYGDFTLFASTSLISLFEEEKGPELYPFTVGLTVLAF